MLASRVKLALVFAVAASAACGADLPAADGLIRRFIDASGGMAAYEAVRTLAMEGTVEIVGRNISGSVTMAQEGRKTYTGMELSGVGKIEEGFDGETAWQSSEPMGTRLLDGEEKALARRGANLAIFASWRDEYTSAATTGSEESDGRPAWKVTMTPKEGRPENYYFDRETGLLSGIGVTVATPLGDIATRVLMADYRAAGGLKTPFRVTQEAFGQSIRMTFSKVTVNAPIPAGRFDLPAAVKALAAKQQ